MVPRLCEFFHLLDSESRNLVKMPVGSTKAYRRALQIAEQLKPLMPRNATCLSTLGIAQCRVGAYSDAEATLSQVDMPFVSQPTKTWSGRLWTSCFGRRVAPAALIRQVRKKNAKRPTLNVAI